MFHTPPDNRAAIMLHCTEHKFNYVEQFDQSDNQLCIKLIHSFAGYDHTIEYMAVFT